MTTNAGLHMQLWKYATGLTPILSVSHNASRKNNAAESGTRAALLSCSKQHARLGSRQERGDRVCVWSAGWERRRGDRRGRGEGWCVRDEAADSFTCWPCLAASFASRSSSIAAAIPTAPDPSCASPPEHDVCMYRDVAEDYIYIMYKLVFGDSRLCC